MWCAADPDYFYARGFLYGFVLASFLWGLVFPVLKRFFGRWK